MNRRSSFWRICLQSSVPRCFPFFQSALHFFFYSGSLTSHSNTDVKRIKKDSAYVRYWWNEPLIGDADVLLSTSKGELERLVRFSIVLSQQQVCMAVPGRN